MQIRTIAILSVFLLCLGLIACDEVLFTHKAKGRNPLELAGQYFVQSVNEDHETENGILDVRHTGNSVYEIWHGEERVFSGEIVAKGNDYFINVPDSSRPEYWHIYSFRLLGDSAYNLFSAFGMSEEQEDALEVERFFKRYESEAIDDSDEDTRYYVNNRRRETYRAFAALHDSAIAKGEGVLFQKITPPAVDTDKASASPEPGMKLGPNPFGEMISVSLAASANSRLMLLDMSGRVLLETRFEGKHYDWSLPNLPAGMYFLRWVDQANGKSEIQRIVKQ